MCRLAAWVHYEQAAVFQPEIRWFAISRFDLEFATWPQAYGSDRRVESHRWFIVGMPADAVLAIAVLIADDNAEFVASQCSDSVPQVSQMVQVRGFKNTLFE